MILIFVLGLLAGAIAVVTVLVYRRGGELGRRSEEITRSLAPISEHLQRVGQEVARLERDRHNTHGQVQQLFETMRAEVERLRDQTGTLVTALRRPQVRGAWGEMQLRSCV